MVAGQELFVILIPNVRDGDTFSFSTPVDISFDDNFGGGDPLSMAIVDLDGDSISEVVICHEGVASIIYSALYKDGDFVYKDYFTIDSQDDTVILDAIDFDLSGTVDIVGLRRDGYVLASLIDSVPNGNMFHQNLPFKIDSPGVGTLLSAAILADDHLQLVVLGLDAAVRVFEPAIFDDSTTVGFNKDPNITLSTGHQILIEDFNADGKLGTSSFFLFFS